MAAPPEKLNRFKPAEPSIPGVPQHAPEEKKAQELTRAGPKPSWQSPRMMAVAGIGGIALLAGVALAWEVMKPAAPPAPVVIAAPDAAAKPDDATPTVTVTPQLPDAPGPVATVDELAKPWSFAKFQIHRLSGE